ncbi:bifunctional hydroxymethylpyrimidine kinase/phosphomethylpyrimidine kinase, partial [Cohnella xylanilytica]
MSERERRLSGSARSLGVAEGPPPPRALTIAGSDSGGGAGIQADLKTFQELGVFGMSAVTALTAQNSLGVQRIEAVSPDMVEAQLDSVLGDIGADAAKTGMLPTAAIVEAAASALRRYGVSRLVVDPVRSAKDGSELSGGEAFKAMKEKLLP